MADDAGGRKSTAKEVRAPPLSPATAFVPGELSGAPPSDGDLVRDLRLVGTCRGGHRVGEGSGRPVIHLSRANLLATEPAAILRPWTSVGASSPTSSTSQTASRGLQMPGAEV